MNRNRGKAAGLGGMILLLLILSLTGCGEAGATPPAASPIASVPALSASPSQPRPSAPPTSTAATALPSLSTVPQALLPHSLCFLAADSNQENQVWRLDEDGITLHQVTADPDGVTDYDLSPKGGWLAYATGRGLYLAALDGSAVEKILESPAADGSDLWLYKEQINHLVWSPDGKMLAYAHNGVNLFDPAARIHEILLQNRYEDIEGAQIPEKLYSPAVWSPDGKKLVINEDYLEGGVRWILDLPTRKEIKLERPDGNSPCCTASWSPDGRHLFMTGIPYGTATSDLWMYDPESGRGTVLIPATNPDGTSNYIDFLKPVSAQDLVFFSAGNALDTPENTPLAMVSAQVTQATVQNPLRSDQFFVYESLWAEDGSLAVIVQPAPGEQTAPFHGPVVLVPAADSPAHALAADGRMLRWGP